MLNRGQTCSAPCTEYPLSVHFEPPRHWIIGAVASLTPRFVIPHFPKTLVHSFQTTVSSWCHFTFSSLPLPRPLLAAPAPLLSPLCYHASPPLFLDLHVLLLVEDLSWFPHLRNHQPHPLDLWTHHLCPEEKSNINLIA